ncbi:MAG: hypothetical protein K2X81_19205 [Candidatus Obscuribacterales bacterium]|nr:hypothetical protein [Candidatus Obscuribacterales bacterium]
MLPANIPTSSRKYDLDLARREFLGAHTEVLWSASNLEIPFHRSSAFVYVLCFAIGLAALLCFKQQLSFLTQVKQQLGLVLLFGCAVATTYFGTQTQCFAFLCKDKLTVVTRPGKKDQELLVIPIKNIKRSAKTVLGEGFSLIFLDENGRENSLSIPVKGNYAQLANLIKVIQEH